ncbi:hypothetical protein CAMRE0001_0845 [Campylobacter rectus RM3267]|uniref:Uncharacterized protein n=1 Tax=Campylobacter rectus RM3267 TaxID=553218 RepID=B9D4Y2_CAMRE|nr:hypothetical protein CAMRE0001_0845 [Campylobacter rectus RM3267]
MERADPSQKAVRAKSAKFSERFTPKNRTKFNMPDRKNDRVQTAQIFPTSAG